MIWLHWERTTAFRPRLGERLAERPGIAGILDVLPFLNGSGVAAVLEAQR
jgi:hypothetical protein